MTVGKRHVPGAFAACGGALRVAAGLALAGLVAGCGGGSSATDVAKAKAIDYQTMANEVVGDGTSANPGMSHTSVANMGVTSGSAEFKGYAGVVLYDSSNPDTSAVLVGDARLTADFNGNTVSGLATNFYGTRTNPVTGDPVESVGAYSGSLVLSQGCIGATACSGAVSNPYEAAGRVDGTLTRGSHSVGVSTAVEGQIYGNPAPKAIALAGVGSGSVDGTSMNSAVSIVAKKK